MKTSIIAAAGLALSAAVAHAQPAALEEVSCAIVAKAPGAENASLMAAPNLSVLETTRETGLFQLSVPEDYKVDAILCERNSIVPSEADLYVPASGYTLYLETYEDGEKTAVGKLSLKDGVYAYDVLLGELTSQEQAGVDARLAAYGERVAEGAASRESGQ